MNTRASDIKLEVRVACASDLQVATGAFGHAECPILSWHRGDFSKVEMESKDQVRGLLVPFRVMLLGFSRQAERKLCPRGITRMKIARNWFSPSTCSRPC
mmetsp:Transcript_18402/g.32602  ORF Transcript_18402/g.32602 Transcript_18402/m.32602 type:complete len:100 (+) Transcript_18402:230-529(+)